MTLKHMTLETFHKFKKKKKKKKQLPQTFINVYWYISMFLISFEINGYIQECHSHSTQTELMEIIGRLYFGLVGIHKGRGPLSGLNKVDAC